MTLVLRAIGLSCRFGGLLAVDGVSLDLHRGELHAVIGPNGAGKSTLINLLSGARAPDAGRLVLGGPNATSKDVTGWPEWRLARAGIGRSFQRTDVMREMTVLENARLAAQARRVNGLGLWRQAARDTETVVAADAALARVGLTTERDRIAGTLSHGALRQLEIAMALATAPTVLLLDEPLAGMGPEESSSLAALLRDLARDHAVLLVEHDMDVVFAVADRISVLADGKLLESGTPAAIQASDAVRAAYLGTAA